MADDTVIKPTAIVTSEAPTSRLSGADIAQPYTMLANALNKVSGGLEDLAEPFAERAGAQAVTRDAQGNIQVDRLPIFGKAGDAYARAVKMAALAQGEGDAKRADIELRQKYHDNPQGYLAAADAFRDATIKKYTDSAGPAVGIAIGRAVDSSTTMTYRGLLNEKESLDLKRSVASMDAGINSAKDDLMALARGGVSKDDPAFVAARTKLETLVNEKVNNPRLAYPRETAEYELQQLDGELGGQAFLHNIDQIYKDAPNKFDGAKNALERAKSVLTDTSLKLTAQQRQQYYSRAVGEVHANEAIRRQDIGEANAAFQAMRLASAYGAKIEPQEVEQVRSAYKAAGDPAGLSRLDAWSIRAPLNDEFGRQPLHQQLQQLNELQGAPRQKAAFEFFQSKGWTKEQAAGIIGGLRGETENLNTKQLHDAGIGIGIAGWNKDRRTALMDFAKSNNMNPADLTTQLEFVDHELRTNEMRAGTQLRAARTPEEAAQAMLNYLRPANFDQPGAHPERARYARMAFNTFTGTATDAGLGDVGNNPAGAMWLQANRANTIKTEARTSWKMIMDDYAKTGMRPSDENLFDLENAARMTNDHDLLEKMTEDVARMDRSKELSGAPLPTQHSAITQGMQAAEQGVLRPGESAVLKDLQRRNEAITKGLADNPIATTVTNFADRFATPPPLTLQDPQQFAAGIMQRGRIAQFAQQNWQGGPVSALDKVDREQIKTVLDGPDLAAKSTVFQGLSMLPEDVRNATLKKLAEGGGPTMAVAVAAGTMVRTAPDIAQSILRGQMAEKTDKAYWPTAAGEAQPTQDKLNELLPPTAFNLQGATNPQGDYAVSVGMVKARYADLSAQAGDVTGKLSKDRLAQAVNDVTGGVLSHNGRPLIAPARGMSQVDFDRVLNGVTDNDLAGVTTLSGMPVKADYLRSMAQLESFGQGKYLVRLGRDTATYAYQNANTEAPTKFVLDLRGRQPGQPNVGMSDYFQGIQP